MGRLGKDPETKYTQQGSAITKATVATTRVWFDNESQKREDTEWHNVTLFGKQAEHFSQYLKKGNQVFIEGRNKTSMYEKDGVKHYRTEVVVEQFRLVDAKKQQQQSEENSEEKPKQQQKAKQKPKPKKQEQETELPPDYPDDSFSGDEDLSSQNNDDIPF